MGPKTVAGSTSPANLAGPMTKTAMLRRYLIVYALLVLATLLTPTSHSASAIVGPVQTTPSTSSEKRNHGVELYRQGKFGEASKVLQNAVKENKTDDEAWYYLGLAFFHQPKKIKDAVKAFETAINLRPKFAAAHTGLAYTHLRRNKFSEAVRVARAALTIDPSLAEPHYIIGVVHVNSGDAKEALAEARESIRLNSEFPPPYLLMSQALVTLSTRKPGGSSRFTQSASPSQTPEQRAERLKRRLAAAALLKEAWESLHTYLRLNPSDPSAELWTEQLATLKAHGSYTGDKNGGGVLMSADEVTTKARVLSKPEPAYTELARKAQVTGTVVLRAVFASDGTVRHILVLVGLPNGLTESAIRAAQQIKFIPATIDGHPVSMFVQLEYNFNLY